MFNDSLHGASIPENPIMEGLGFGICFQGLGLRI